MSTSIMMMSIASAMGAKNVLKRDRKYFRISILNKQLQTTKTLLIDMKHRREMHRLIMIKLSRNLEFMMRLLRILRQLQW
jgi:hypothetical protein